THGPYAKLMTSGVAPALQVPASKRTVAVFAVPLASVPDKESVHSRQELSVDAVHCAIPPPDMVFTTSLPLANSGRLVQLDPSVRIAFASRAWPACVWKVSEVLPWQVNKATPGA